MNIRRLASFVPAWLLVPMRRMRAELLDVHASKSYSQEGEDMILRRIFERQGRGFYVDVGAHHPRRFSNTYFFYCKGWRGINIEPNPEATALFRKERSRDINLQIGVSEEEGRLTYNLFDDPALNSFSENLRDVRLKANDYRLVGTLEIPVQRLDAILRRYITPEVQIDFLTIDVEGLDMSVLRSNDWSTFRPAWVLIESLGSTFQKAASSEEALFMNEHGYELFAKTVNTLIFMRST